MDQNLAATYILPELGKKRLGAISANDVMAFLKSFRNAGKKATTRNRVLSVLRSIFKTASKKGYLDASLSPVANIPNEVIRAKTKTLLSAEDLRKVIQSLEESPDQEAKFLHLMLLINAGKAELLNAKWRNLSESGRTLLLEQKYGVGHRLKEYLLSPKAMEIIESLPRGDSPWMFPGTNPEKHMSDIYYYWNKLRNECGLPGLKLHDLQMSLVVCQIKEGAHIMALNEIFGYGVTLQARKMAAEA